MLYVNKKSKEVVELLFSDNEMCVYVASIPIDDGVEGTIGEGIVFKGTKKSFKRFFKKANKKIQDTYTELDEAAKDEVYAITLGDRYGIMNHSAEYIQGNIKLQDKEAAEYHAGLTEEEYLQSLEDLKDK